jgi:hypothetical protein
MVSRGYASLSFLHTAAEEISKIHVPSYVYHFGDYDPSGVNAYENIQERLRELAPDAEIYFERVAVTPEQIERYNLPTRPTKTSDSRSKGFGDISAELDAFEPDHLRAMVQATIEQHMPQERFEALLAAEESERELLKAFSKSFILANPECRAPDPLFEEFWQQNGAYLTRYGVTKDMAQRAKMQELTPGSDREEKQIIAAIKRKYGTA